MSKIAPVRCEYTELLPVNQLKPHPKNRNQHPTEQLARLAKLISFHGFRHPVIVSKLSGFIVAGHGRWEAAKIIGLKEVPVDYQDFDDEAAEYAFLVSDNAIAAWAELDLSGINADIGDLGPDFDIDLLGIENFVVEPADKLDPQCDEDDVPEAPVDPKTRLGDVYQLGRHRLMCGDSTSIDAVERLMDGEKAGMVLTDPPYGMFLDADFSSLKGSLKAIGKKSGSQGNKYENVIGDHEDFSPELIHTIFAAFGACKEVFLFGADYYAEHLPNKNDGSWLVWDKRKESQAEAIGAEFELCWSKQKHKRRVLRHDWSGFLSSKNTQDARNRVHPTQKPVTLFEDMIQQWGNEGDNVVDLYGGSGSTLIACEKTGRQCFMMELDPAYVSVIIERWRKFTGKEAYLLNEDGSQTAWTDVKNQEGR